MTFMTFKHGLLSFQLSCSASPSSSRTLWSFLRLFSPSLLHGYSRIPNLTQQRALSESQPPLPIITNLTQKQNQQASPKLHHILLPSFAANGCPCLLPKLHQVYVCPPRVWVSVWVSELKKAPGELGEEKFWKKSITLSKVSPYGVTCRGGTGESEAACNRTERPAY